MDADSDRLYSDHQRGLPSHARNRILQPPWFRWSGNGDHIIDLHAAERKYPRDPAWQFHLHPFGADVGNAGGLYGAEVSAAGT